MLFQTCIDTKYCSTHVHRNDLNASQKLASVLFELPFIVIAYYSFKMAHTQIKKRENITKFYWIIAFFLITLPIVRIIYQLDSIIFPFYYFEIFQERPDHCYLDHFLFSLPTYQLLKDFQLFGLSIMQIVTSLIWIQFSNTIDEAPWKQTLITIYKILICLTIFVSFLILVFVIYTGKLDISNSGFEYLLLINNFVAIFCHIKASFVTYRTISEYFNGKYLKRILYTNAFLYSSFTFKNFCLLINKYCWENFHYFRIKYCDEDEFAQTLIWYIFVTLIIDVLPFCMLIFYFIPFIGEVIQTELNYSSTSDYISLEQNHINQYEDFLTSRQSHLERNTRKTDTIILK